MIDTLVDIGVSPIDEYNTKLLDNVHPAKWKDAEPDGVSYINMQQSLYSTAVDSLLPKPFGCQVPCYY